VTACSIASPDGVVMRTAPCPTAPPVRINNQALVIPFNATFNFTDANSRQTSACGQFGYSPEDSTTCWVQGTYGSTIGWVSVSIAGPEDKYVDPICTLGYKAGGGQLQTFLVSDGIAYEQKQFTAFQPSTGCALPTEQISAACFPGDATVLLRSGEARQMFQLVLGDEVGERGEQLAPCQGAHVRVEMWTSTL
jgi:hypothetical protein